MLRALAVLACLLTLIVPQADANGLPAVRSISCAQLLSCSPGMSYRPSGNCGIDQDDTPAVAETCVLHRSRRSAAS